MLNNTVLLRKRHLAVAVSGALALFASLQASASTLRIAMTAADIPLTLGQPDQGYEGNRFTGIPLYDALVEWDLSQGEKPSGLVPGLATEWHVDPQNQNRWIFTLRPGVKFHDGSEVNADAIVWNVDKVLNKAAPQYAPGQIGNTLSRMPTLSGAEKSINIRSRSPPPSRMRCCRTTSPTCLLSRRRRGRNSMTRSRPASAMRRPAASRRGRRSPRRRWAAVRLKWKNWFRASS
jgi:hypothetical protein